MRQDFNMRRKFIKNLNAKIKDFTFEMLIYLIMIDKVWSFV